MGESSTATDAPARRSRRRLAAGLVPVLAGCLIATTWFVLRGADRWPVDACTILYVGTDLQLHLTNERGKVNVQLPGPSALGEVVARHAPPTWSPSGRRIAYVHSTLGGHRHLVTIDPLTRQQWVHPLGEAGDFGGWLDDETVLDTAVGRRNAATGEVRRIDSPESRFAFAEAPSLRVVHDPFRLRERAPPDMTHLSPDPMTGGYVAIGDGVHLRDRDLRETAPVGRGEVYAPRMDASGEWVGWTVRLGVTLWIAIERLSAIDTDADLSTPQRFLGHQFGSAVFSGWTDDGNVLANVTARPLTPAPAWRLVVLDKEGNLVREVPTDVAPLAKSAASIRPRPPR